MKTFQHRNQDNQHIHGFKLLQSLILSNFFIAPLYWRNQAKADLDNAIKNQPIIGKAKNTIIMLGDGMSMSTVTSSRILKGQLDGKTGEETILSWETFPHIALSKV